GVNFRAGGESSPVVANGVVYIGKGPISPIKFGSGVLSYNAAGCGHSHCMPLGIAKTGLGGLFFGSTPAVVDGHVFIGAQGTSHPGAGGLWSFTLPAAEPTPGG